MFMFQDCEHTAPSSLSSEIESYCRTWRMELEDTNSILTGDKIVSASSTAQSTSISDDIELGAV